MADVVLIYPRTLWDIPNVTTRLPLAVLYVGSMLQAHGFRVEVIDQRVEKDWEERLRRSVEAERPLFVGISSMTGRQIAWGLRAARLVREIAPEVPLVWGGVHPTILPDQTLDHPLVDVVVVGEGEGTALELAQVWRDGGRNADLSGVAGLVYDRDGERVHTAPRPWIPVDELPLLDYGLLRSIEPYVLAEVPGERSLQMTTSRGCPMRCGYCYLGTVPNGRRWRGESPERVVDRIERMQRLFHLNAVHIIDDEFFTDRKRAWRICELILERGIKVTLRTNCRVDYIDRMDMEMLHLMRRAGFRHLYLGVESGSDRVLAFINKGITREQVLRVNRKLRDAGIAPKFSFMGGFPGETIEEVRETIDLMLRLTQENPEARTTPIQLYSPYPGTPLFSYCVEQGMPMPSSLEEWADSSWERLEYSWLTPSEVRFLEKAAYFTFFLDGKTVAESARSVVVRWLARLYGQVVRLRSRVGFYGLMPEVGLIKRVLESA